MIILSAHHILVGNVRNRIVFSRLSSLIHSPSLSVSELLNQVLLQRTLLYVIEYKSRSQFAMRSGYVPSIDGLIHQIIHVLLLRGVKTILSRLVSSVLQLVL